MLAQAHFFPRQLFFFNCTGEGFSGPPVASSRPGRWPSSHTLAGCALPLVLSLAAGEARRQVWMSVGALVFRAGVSSLNVTSRCPRVFLRRALPPLPVGTCGLRPHLPKSSGHPSDEVPSCPVLLISLVASKCQVSIFFGVRLATQPKLCYKWQRY